MLFHYTTHYGHEIGHLTAPLLGFPIGNYGVQLFFLISGFVIFMTLERTHTAMDFVVSRFSRLYPAYWASFALSALFVYTVGLPEQRLRPSELMLNLTMFQQFLGARHLDGSYWTLQVELFFYIQMLFWFYIGQMHHIRRIIVVWLLTALAFAMAHRMHHDFSWTLGELLIIQHIPFFALGILFYQMHQGSHNRWHTHALIIACAAVVAMTQEPIYGIVALSCSGVFYLVTYGALGWLALRPFVLLGSISYSLYLLHQVIGFDIIWHVEHDMHVSGSLAVLIAMAISIGLALLLTRIVEQPSLRWIRSQWKQRHKIAPTQPGPGV